MTVETSNVISGPFIGNGVTTRFPRNFSISAADHVVVTFDGVTQSGGYTVLDPDQTTADVEFNAAPSAGVEIFFTRETPIRQDTDYSSQGSVSPEQIERDVDYRTRVEQENKRDLMRSLKAPLGQEGKSFPVLSAGRWLTTDVDGNVIDGGDSSQIANAQSYAERAEVAAEIALLNGTGTAETTDQIKNLNVIEGISIFLTATGKEGRFVYRLGDYSTEVALDTLEGVYIQSDNESASEGAWVRVTYGIVRPEWFGAVGDGVVNDNAALEAALDLSDLLNEPVILGPKTYVKSAPIDRAKLQILGSGADSVIDMSGIAGDYEAINAGGTGRSDAVGVSTNLSVGNFGFTTDTALDVLVGDYVQITSDDVIEYDGSTIVKQGEIKRVRSISGTSIKFDTAIYETYLSANNIQVHKLNLQEGIRLEDFTIVCNGVETDNTDGINLRWYDAPSVKNIKVRDARTYCIAINSGVNAMIDGCDCDGVEYTGVGLVFYGIVVLNNAMWTHIINSKGRMLRHLITTTASQSEYGQPYFTMVNGATISNAQAGGDYASFAYEAHGYGKWTTWNAIAADSCHTVINLENGYQTVTGMTGTNCRVNGILFGDSSAGRDLENIVISGFNISKDSNDSSGVFVGIYFPANANSVRKNISISDGVISQIYRSSSAHYGARLLAGQSDAKNCSINNVSFETSGAQTTSDFGLRLEDDGWVLSNIKTSGFERAIYIVADDVSISDPIVSVVSPSLNQSIIEIAGARNVVVGAVSRGGYRPLNLRSTSASNVIAHLTAFGNTAAIADSGTGNSVT